jgi:uncharacterized membrane protein YfcA
VVISILEISIICLVGIGMGAMGAIIGSTLLVLVPMLSLFGMPIQTAIGTAKVSVIGREIIPAIYFQRKNLAKTSLGIPFSLAGMITSWYGSVVAVSLDAGILEKIVGICMCLISAIILLNPKIGLLEKEITPTPLTTILSVLVGSMVGFYNGIFGGGANVFIIFGFILIFGNTFLQATATSKLPNLLLALASIPMFVINDFVSWKIAIPLTISTTAGSYFGAKMAVKKGSRFIRLLFVGLVCVLAVKYLL